MADSDPYAKGRRAITAKPAYLQRLGLATDCTEAEIAKAYRRLARQLHPDHGGTKESFQQLLADYEQAKRYAEEIASRRQKPRQGWNPAERTNSFPASRSAVGRTTVLGATVVVLIVLLAFGTGRFPFAVVACLALAMCLAMLLLMAIGLPMLPRAGATATYLAGWLIVTGLLIFFYPDLLVLMRQPEYSEWAPLIVLIPFAYGTLTIIGGMSWLISLINKG